MSDLSRKNQHAVDEAHIQAVVDRLHHIKGTSSSRGLSLALGQSPRYISNVLDRRLLPWNVLYALAEDGRFSLDWLVFGR